MFFKYRKLLHQFCMPSMSRKKKFTLFCSLKVVDTVSKLWFFFFSFVVHVYAKYRDKVDWKIARLLLLTHDIKDVIKLSWLFTSYYFFFFSLLSIPLRKKCPYSEFFWSVFSPKVEKYRQNSEYRQFSRNVTEKK